MSEENNRADRRGSGDDYLFLRSIWGIYKVKICLVALLFRYAAMNRMIDTLDSPEDAHAQLFDVVCPSRKPCPSDHRDRVAQSHLAHSLSV